jgi:hypothetical protein
VVTAFPDVHSRTAEEAWEQEIIDTVSAAVHADQTLDTVAVRQLEYEDCEWVFEIGMPMAAYGVTVFPNGSWHSGTPFARYEADGQDLQSLFDYLVEKGLVRCCSDKLPDRLTAEVGRHFFGQRGRWPAGLG